MKLFEYCFNVNTITYVELVNLEYQSSVIFALRIQNHKWKLRTRNTPVYKYQTYAISDKKMQSKELVD